jgi:hypothetical protein
MGCNCKKTPQVLNYEKSQDHINLIQETLKGLDIENLTDLDKVQLVSVFKSIYPNSKITPTPENIIGDLQRVVGNFYSQKR